MRFHRKGLKNVLCHFQAKGHAVESVSAERGVECGDECGLFPLVD